MEHKRKLRNSEPRENIARRIADDLELQSADTSEWWQMIHFRRLLQRSSGHWRSRNTHSMDS